MLLPGKNCYAERIDPDMAEAATIPTGNGPPESDIDSRLKSVFSAVSSNNIEAVKMLLKTGISVTTTNAEGESLLFVAAAVGAVEIVRMLITEGAIINGARRDGQTPLAEATRLGHSRVAQVLIASGADINKKCAKVDAPLSSTGHSITTDSIRRFLQARIDTGVMTELACREDADALSSGDTSFCDEEDEDDDEDDVAILVRELQLNPNVREDLDADLKAAKVAVLSESEANELLGAYDTSCHSEDYGRSEDREAVDLSESVVSSDEFAVACKFGDMQAVQQLLRRNADVNVICDCGHTPLHLAVNNGHTDIAWLLISCNADVTQLTVPHKDSLLGIAASAGDLEIAEYVIGKNLDIEHRNDYGYTPLCFAAEAGNVEMIKLLLAKGADINASITSPEPCGSGSRLRAKVRSSKNSSKACPKGHPNCGKSSERHIYTPLMAAALSGRTNAAQLLIKKGCDINLQLDGNTALSLACMKGHLEVVELILENSNTGIEHRLQKGYTRLMEAASGGFCAVGEVLISRGAAVNATIPVTKDTALMIAAEKGHIAFVNLLLNHGGDVNLRNKRGCSALWLACHGGHAGVVSKLCSHKADVESQDWRGVSCLVAALKQGCVDVVKVLVRRLKRFPSDDECSRHLAIVNDEQLRVKRLESLELIKAARKKHEKNADLNASRLLLQIEKEKKRVVKRSKAADQQEKKKPQLSVTTQRQLATKSEHCQPVPDSNDKLEASLRSSSQASVVGNGTLTLSSAYCLEPAVDADLFNVCCSDVKPCEGEWQTAGKSDLSNVCPSKQNLDEIPSLLAPPSSTLVKVSREGDKTSTWNSKKITAATSTGADVGIAAAASGTSFEAAGLVAAGGEENEVISKQVTVPPEAGAILLSSKALAAMRQWSGAAIDVCGTDGDLRFVCITGSRSAVRGARSVFAALIQNPSLSLDKQLSTPLPKRGRRLQQQRRPQQQAVQPLPVERNGVLVAQSASMAPSPQLQSNPALPCRQPSYSRFAAAIKRSVGTSARAPDACSVAAAAAASLQPTRHSGAAFVLPPGEAVATPVLPEAACSEAGMRACLWRDVVAGAAVPASREDSGRSRMRERAESVNASPAHSAAVLSPAAECTATAAATLGPDETILVKRDPAAVLPPVRPATVVSDSAEAASRAATAETEVVSTFNGLVPWPCDVAAADFDGAVGYNTPRLVPEFELELPKRSGNWLAVQEVTPSYVGDRYTNRPPPARNLSTSKAVGFGRSAASYRANNGAVHSEESHTVADAAVTSVKDYYGPNAPESRQLLTTLGSGWGVSQPQLAMSKAAGDLPIDSLPANSEFDADYRWQAVFGHAARPADLGFGFPADLGFPADFGIQADLGLPSDFSFPATFDRAVGSDVLPRKNFDHAALSGSTNSSVSESRWHPANDSRGIGSFVHFASTNRTEEFPLGSSARGSLSTGGLPSGQAGLAVGLPYRQQAAWSYGTANSQFLPSRSGDDFGMQVGAPFAQPSVSTIGGHPDFYRSSEPPSHMRLPQNQKPPFSNH